jgi:hypothetical protein
MRTLNEIESLKPGPYHRMMVEIYNLARYVLLSYLLTCFTDYYQLNKHTQHSSPITGYQCLGIRGLSACDLVRV